MKLKLSWEWNESATTWPGSSSDATRAFCSGIGHACGNVVRDLDCQLGHNTPIIRAGLAGATGIAANGGHSSMVALLAFSTRALAACPSTSGRLNVALEGVDVSSCLAR